MTNLRAFEPFSPEGEPVDEGGLIVTNGAEAITLSGRLTIARDKPGLEHARAFKALFEKIVLTLERQDTLPGKTAAPEKDAP